MPRFRMHNSRPQSVNAGVGSISANAVLGHAKAKFVRLAAGNITSEAVKYSEESPSDPRLPYAPHAWHIVGWEFVDSS